MKKLLLIITLLCVVIVSNSYNYGNISAYYNKTLEIMYDSKKRPHKIAIYSGYKCKRLRVYTLHNSKKAVTAD